MCFRLRRQLNPQAIGALPIQAGLKGQAEAAGLGGILSAHPTDPMQFFFIQPLHVLVGVVGVDRGAQAGLILQQRGDPHGQEVRQRQAQQAHNNSAEQPFILPRQYCAQKSVPPHHHMPSVVNSALSIVGFTAWPHLPMGSSLELNKTLNNVDGRCAGCPPASKRRAGPVG